MMNFQINISPVLKLIFLGFNYFSYNDASLIDPILRDRITEIKVKPLTTKDKNSNC